MILSKAKKYIHNIGIYYSIKLFLFIKISRLLKIKNDYKIKIKTKKTGKEIIYVRPNTTDIYLVNNLLLDNGEYDFLYNKEFSWVKNSKVIIDAGACIGFFSRMIREINDDMLIIAIEPEVNNYKLLKENTKKYNNIMCIKKGLWNKKSNLIVEPSTSGEWGFTVKEVKNNRNDSVESIGILDLMKEYKLESIDILKVDIEGSEIKVFDESSKHWLDKVKMCIIEFHDRRIPGCSNKIINLMKKYNFIYNIYEENYVFVKR